MKLVEGLHEATAELARLRAEGKRLGFVPTMGALHEGHLSLVQRARELADLVVVSVFVNPLQFGPGEDLERYPRDLEGDATKLERAGAHLLFTVTAEEMYPAGFSTYVTVEGPLTSGLCSAHRQGHFRGVTTVVAKLFGIVAPNVAVFGRKDLQQALVLSRMATDLNLPIRMVIAPTVRETDGLAMSSRNQYLDADERAQALALSRGLRAGLSALGAGERDPARVVAIVREAGRDCERLAWEYVEVVGLEDLAPAAAPLEPPVAIVCAARVGATRLIDNVLFPEDALSR